jgi:hypothetical protein
MTIVITIPEFYTGWPVFLAILVPSLYLTSFITRIRNDRSWQIDVTRRAAQQIDMPWATPGIPPLLNRIDAEKTIFKRHPWKDDPSFDWREAA